MVLVVGVSVCECGGGVRVRVMRRVGGEATNHCSSANRLQLLEAC